MSILNNTLTSGTMNNTIQGSGITTNNVNGSLYNFLGVNNTNVTNLSGITGSFVNISFFFDSSNLSTGLNLVEGFVSRDFLFTGYGLGAYNSGTQGILSGSLYQRTPINTKVQITNFVLNSGLFFYASGGLSQTVSGMNRIGVDILRLGTGFTGFSVGAFGVGY